MDRARLVLLFDTTYACAAPFVEICQAWKLLSMKNGIYTFFTNLSHTYPRKRIGIESSKFPIFEHQNEDQNEDEYEDQSEDQHEDQNED